MTYTCSCSGVANTNRASRQLQRHALPYRVLLAAVSYGAAVVSICLGACCVTEASCLAAGEPAANTYLTKLNLWCRILHATCCCCRLLPCCCCCHLLPCCRCRHLLGCLLLLHQLVQARQLPQHPQRHRQGAAAGRCQHRMQHQRHAHNNL
jgi:hypothetical protein